MHEGVVDAHVCDHFDGLLCLAFAMSAVDVCAH